MTTELGGRLSYSIARARHRHRRRPAGAPLVVFSMAKTGSSAVADALRATGAGPVHHVHDLDPDHLAREEREYRWGGRPWRIWDAEALLRRPPTADAPWRVVSLVREPIAQTVSAFFQPAVRRGYVRDDTTLAALRDRFADRLDRLPVRWFDTRLEPALGIDVFAHAFDPAVGYQIISTPAVRLLLLRQEGLAVAPHALAELLERAEPVPLARANVAADKAYADLYAEFTDALAPTEAQLDRAYGSRVVHHFYSAAEIDRFRQLWGEPRATGAVVAPGDDDGDR